MASFISEKDRLHIMYWLMCIVVFLQVVFICAIIFFTTRFILVSYQAASFLEKINVIPFAYYKVPVYALLCFILLLVIMQLRSRIPESTRNVLLLLVMEIVICLALMYVTSFTSNYILLFVIANMLALTSKKGNKGISLIIMTLVFLVTNYNVISNVFPIIDFQYYLEVYSTPARSLFLGINNILSTLCIICFALYMMLLIQDQYNESHMIRSLNQELQRLNEQLKEYADVREKMGETKERNRLAREIHDTLGHTLTGLSTGLEACKTIMETDSTLAKEQLMILSNVARDGLKDVRRSVRKLRPDALENHTLQEALESMLKEFSDTTGVTIHFICHLSSLNFQTDEEDTIYRIIQEGTTNALRHGLASEIFISFGRDQEQLIIIMEDNGCGCASIKEGFGLHHMQERVALLNGTLRFYGTNGFVLIVELPIRREHV